MSDCFISGETAQNDLLDCAAFLAERIKSSDGRGDAMIAIIPRYLAKGNVDLSAELANAVSEPYSRDKLLMLVAEKCAEVNDIDYGQQLAEAIEDHGLQAQAMERIALVEAREGRVAKAFEIAGVIAHPDFVYAGIAAYQASNGDEQAASDTLEQIVFPSAKVSSLLQLAAARIKNGEPEAAVEPLARAVEAADDIEHSEEKIRNYCEIGNLFIEIGEQDRAIKTFELARDASETLDNTHRDFFLANSAMGLLFAGDRDLADSTLDLVTDKTQMSSALLGFARDHWKKGEKEDAVDTLEEAYEILKSQREKETRDSRSRNALLATLAAQFAGFGKTDRGVDIASENVDPTERIAALSQIAQILTVQKEHELARQTIELIDEDASRLLAIIEISDTRHSADETDEAIKLLDEAASLAETVVQFGARSNVLNSIASRYVKYGQLEKARAVAKENLAIIAEIRDESTQAAALASLSEIYDQAQIELSEAEMQYLGLFVRKAGW